MPRTLTINELPDDDEQVTELVDQIAHQIGNGFTSGYYGYFDRACNGETHRGYWELTADE